MPTKADILALGTASVNRTIYADDTGRMMVVPSGLPGSAAYELAGRYFRSETAPVSPREGDTWFKSDSGMTYTRYEGVWMSDSPAYDPGDPAGSAAAAAASSAPLSHTHPDTEILEGPPFNAGATVTGDIVLDRANGAYQKLTLTGATVARIFQSPAGGTEGQTITTYVTSAAGVSRTLDFNGASPITIPSDSIMTLPKTLEQGKTYVVKVRHDGTSWWLLTLTGAY